MKTKNLIQTILNYQNYLIDEFLVVKKTKNGNIILDYKFLKKFTEKKENITDLTIVDKEGNELNFCSCDLNNKNTLFFILKKIYEGYKIKDLKIEKTEPIIKKIDEKRNKIVFNDNNSLEITIKNHILYYKYNINGNIIEFGRKL